MKNILARIEELEASIASSDDIKYVEACLQAMREAIDRYDAKGEASPDGKITICLPDR